MTVSAGHLRVHAHSRTAGHSVGAALGYRFGTEVTDSRTQRRHDYSRRRWDGEIAATGFAHGATVPAWEPTPQGFADALEGAERRCNSIVARDIVVQLPAALRRGAQIALTKEFADEIAGRYDAPIAWAVHPPDVHGDRNNWHAHLLMSTRALDPKTGLPGAKLRQFHIRSAPDAKKGVSARERARNDRGGSAEISHLRALWERSCNAALEAAGSKHRIAMGPVRDADAQRPVLSRGEVRAERILWGERHPNERLQKSVRELVMTNDADGGCATIQGRKLVEHERAHEGRGLGHRAGHGGYHSALPAALEPGEIETTDEIIEAARATPAPEPAIRARKPRQVRAPRKRRRRRATNPTRAASAPGSNPPEPAPAIAPAPAPTPVTEPARAPDEADARRAGAPRPRTPDAPRKRRRRRRPRPPTPAPAATVGPGPTPIEEIRYRGTVIVEVVQASGPMRHPPRPVAIAPIRASAAPSPLWDIVFAPVPRRHAGAASAIDDAVITDLLRVLRALARKMKRLDAHITHALSRPAPRPRRGVAAQTRAGIDPDSAARARGKLKDLEHLRTRALEHRRRVVAARPHPRPRGALRDVLIDRMVGPTRTEEDRDERLRTTEAELRANLGGKSPTPELREDPIRLWMAARWLTAATDIAQQRVWGGSMVGEPEPPPTATPDDAAMERIKAELERFNSGAGRAIETWIDRTAPAAERSTTRWHPYTAVMLDRLLGVSPSGGDRDTRVREMRTALIREMGPRRPQALRADERRVWTAAEQLTEWADALCTRVWGETTHGQPGAPPGRVSPDNTSVERLSAIVTAMHQWERNALAEIESNEPVEQAQWAQRARDRAWRRSRDPEI